MAYTGYATDALLEGLVVGGDEIDAMLHDTVDDACGLGVSVSQSVGGGARKTEGTRGPGDERGIGFGGYLQSSA